MAKAKTNIEELEVIEPEEVIEEILEEVPEELEVAEEVEPEEVIEEEKEYKVIDSFTDKVTKIVYFKGNVYPKSGVPELARIEELINLKKIK